MYTILTIVYGSLCRPLLSLASTHTRDISLVSSWLMTAMDLHSRWRDFSRARPPRQLQRRLLCRRRTSMAGSDRPSHLHPRPTIQDLSALLRCTSMPPVV